MRVKTLLKILSKTANFDARIDCEDSDKYTDNELYEINYAIASLQNELGKLQETFDKNGRKIEVWRG